LSSERDARIADLERQLAEANTRADAMFELAAVTSERDAFALRHRGNTERIAALEAELKANTASFDEAYAAVTAERDTAQALAKNLGAVNEGLEKELEAVTAERERYRENAIAERSARDDVISQLVDATHELTALARTNAELTAERDDLCRVLRIFPKDTPVVDERGSTVPWVRAFGAFEHELCRVLEKAPPLTENPLKRLAELERRAEVVVHMFSGDCVVCGASGGHDDDCEVGILSRFLAESTTGGTK